jgi:hypothetical protein
MFRAFFLAFLAAFAFGFSPASAQPRRAPGVQPLDRVLPHVRDRYPGTFYDADGPFMDEGGNPHYRLKWMTPEGRVIWLDTDARTGRVIGVERGGNRRWRAPHAMPPRDAPPPDYYEGRRGHYNDGYRGHEDHDRGWSGRGHWNGGGRGNWGGNRGGRDGGHHRHGH